MEALKMRGNALEKVVALWAVFLSTSKKGRPKKVAVERIWLVGSFTYTISTFRILISSVPICYQFIITRLLRHEVSWLTIMVMWGTNKNDISLPTFEGVVHTAFLFISKHLQCIRVKGADFTRANDPDHSAKGKCCEIRMILWLSILLKF